MSKDEKPKYPIRMLQLIAEAARWKKKYEMYQEGAAKGLADLAVKCSEKNDEIAKLKGYNDTLVKENQKVTTAFAELRSRHTETLAYCAITEMRLAATEPETDYWQAKAETFVNEFIRTGTIDSETIRKVTRTHPYGYETPEKVSYRRPDANR